MVPANVTVRVDIISNDALVVAMLSWLPVSAHAQEMSSNCTISISPVPPFLSGPLPTSLMPDTSYVAVILNKTEDYNVSLCCCSRCNCVCVDHNVTSAMASTNHTDHTDDSIEGESKG